MINERTEKFTPGPWKPISDTRPIVDTGDFYTEYWVDSDKICVCTMYNGQYMSEDEQEANMHLASAAPEMYDLLKECRKEFNDECHLIQDLCDRIDTVLKKARGEV